MPVPHIFETLNGLSLLPAVLWRLLGGRVYYLESSGRLADSTALPYLEHHGWIERLDLDPRLRRRNNPTVQAALSHVERLAAALPDEPVIRQCLALYGDPDILLAFKKRLLTAMAGGGFYQQLAQAIEQALGGSWRLVPARPSELSTLDGPAARRLERLVPWRSRAVGRMAEWVSRLKAVAACAFIAAMSLWPRRRSGSPREQYPFAISIISPLRQFANPIRSVDFLLDGRNLTRANTLFVPLTRIARDQRRRLRKAGLAVASLGWGVPRDDARKLAACALTMLPHLFRTPSWMALTAVALLREYAVWKAFLARYDIQNFVSHADFGVRHIGRNLVFRHAGARTWCYADTVNTGDPFATETADALRLHEFWAYLVYDTYVTWSRRHSEFLRAHYPKIGEFLAVGCLWSEHVRLIKEGSLHTPLRSALMRSGYRPGVKVVGVFDSTYRNDSITTYDDGVDFLRGIERLLEAYGDIYVVWKEKKSRSEHVGLGSRNLPDLYQQLSEHPRCHFTGSKVSSSEIIALSDLVISFPFTSTTVEAVCGGTKGIYYDPAGKFLGGYYDRIPGFVAHGYEQLNRFAADLLYRIGEDEYREFLERNVRDELDPFLDGRAISRFRDALWRAAAREALLRGSV